MHCVLLYFLALLGEYVPRSHESSRVMGRIGSLDGEGLAWVRAVAIDLGGGRCAQEDAQECRSCRSCGRRVGRKSACEALQEWDKGRMRDGIARGIAIKNRVAGRWVVKTRQYSSGKGDRCSGRVEPSPPVKMMTRNGNSARPAVSSRKRAGREQ